VPAGRQLIDLTVLLPELVAELGDLVVELVDLGLQDVLGGLAGRQLDGTGISRGG
jgi:hypothetical protein